MDRLGATTMRGKPLTLVGPELKSGDKAPDFEAVTDSLQPVNLQGTGPAVRIFSVVPSLDTPVCDAQTKRFNEESAMLAGGSSKSFGGWTSTIHPAPSFLTVWCSSEGSRERSRPVTRRVSPVTKDGSLMFLSGRMLVVNARSAEGL